MRLSVRCFRAKKVSCRPSKKLINCYIFILQFLQILAAGGKQKVFFQKLLLRLKGEFLSIKESSAPEHLIRKAQAFLDGLEAQAKSKEESSPGSAETRSAHEGTVDRDEIERKWKAIVEECDVAQPKEAGPPRPNPRKLG
jgi:hypothetical protein